MCDSSNKFALQPYEKPTIFAKSPHVATINNLRMHRCIMIKITKALVIIVNFGSRDSLYAYIA